MSSTHPLFLSPFSPITVRLAFVFTLFLVASLALAETEPKFTEACAENFKCSFVAQIRSTGKAVTEYDLEFDVVSEGGDVSSRFFRMDVTSVKAGSNQQSEIRPLRFVQQRESGEVTWVSLASSSLANLSPLEQIQKALLSFLVHPLSHSPLPVAGGVAIQKISSTVAGGLDVDEKISFKDLPRDVSVSSTSRFVIDAFDTVMIASHSTAVSASSSSSSAIDISVQRMQSIADSSSSSLFASREEFEAKFAPGPVFVEQHEQDLEKEQQENVQKMDMVVSFLSAFVPSSAVLSPVSPTALEKEGSLLLQLQKMLPVPMCVQIIDETLTLLMQNKLQVGAVEAVLSSCVASDNEQARMRAIELLVDNKKTISEENTLKMKKAILLALFPSSDNLAFTVSDAEADKVLQWTREMDQQSEEVLTALSETSFLLLGSFVRHSSSQISKQILSFIEAALSRAISSKDEHRQIVLTRAVGNAGQVSSLKQLAPLLSSSSPSVRVSVIDSLRFIFPSLQSSTAHEMMREILSNLASSDNDAAVARFARMITEDNIATNLNEEKQLESLEQKEHVQLVSRLLSVPSTMESLLLYSDTGIGADRLQIFGSAGLVAKPIPSKFVRLIDADFATRPSAVHRLSPPPPAGLEDAIVSECEMIVKIKGYDVGLMSHFLASPASCEEVEDGKTAPATTSAAATSDRVFEHHVESRKLSLAGGMISINVASRVASSLVIDLIHADAYCGSKNPSFVVGASPRGSVATQSTVAVETPIASFEIAGEEKNLLHGSIPMTVSATASDNSRACTSVTVDSAAFDSSVVVAIEEQENNNNNNNKLVHRCLALHPTIPSRCFTDDKEEGVLQIVGLMESECIKAPLGELSDDAPITALLEEEDEDNMEVTPEELQLMNRWQGEGKAIDMAAFRSYEAAKTVQKASKVRLEDAMASVETAKNALAKFEKLATLEHDALKKLKIEWGQFQVEGEKMGDFLKGGKGGDADMKNTAGIANRIRDQEQKTFEKLRHSAERVLKAGDEGLKLKKRLAYDSNIAVQSKGELKDPSK